MRVTRDEAQESRTKLIKHTIKLKAENDLRTLIQDGLLEEDFFWIQEYHLQKMFHVTS